MSLSSLFQQFGQGIVEDIVVGVIVGIVLLLTTAIIYFSRDRIRKWLYRRKIIPVYESMVTVYEEKVLPDYIETRPEIRVQLKKEDITLEPKFGYIFVPIDDVERGIDVLLACIPVSSSLRGIRILFDEKLRKSLFNYLSYRLGLEANQPERAVKFRDRAINEYPDEYDAIEKLYEEGKLTGIILDEAITRFRKCKGKPSTSDMKEFSTLVKKLAKMDITLIRIGEASVQNYVDKAVEKRRGTVLLARGYFINKAIEVADKLSEKGFEHYPPNELGLPNPEVGIWHFEYPPPGHDVPLMRIWLRLKEGKKET